MAVWGVGVKFCAWAGRGGAWPGVYNPPMHPALTAAITATALAILTAPAWAEEWELGELRVLAREEWPAVRNGGTVAGIAAVRETVRAMDGGDGRRVVVRHPPGAVGVAWAVELREWLVALGVASADIILEPGDGEDALQLAVVAGARR